MFAGLSTAVPFASHQSFLDPQLTSDGKPYGPYRYQQIVKECSLICERYHITYSDILHMTPIERSMFIKWILERIEKEQKMIEEYKQKHKNK